MKKHLIRISGSVLVLICMMIIAVCMSSDAKADEEMTADNGIPVVYLNIDEEQGTIEDMINSSDHSVYCYGTISIDVPEGFHYTDFADLACEDLTDMEMSIRGRGHSTWARSAKKPFKIKLDKKTDVFSLGKNKHWVLVSNELDASLLKDRVTAWLGDQMGFAFTPRGVPVDVIMKGKYFGTQYLGSYYFSENVRVDDNRLEIAELKEEDTDPDLITGGYLLQNAMQVRKGSPDRFITSRGVDWATNTPSFDTEGDNLSVSEGPEGEESFVSAELSDAYENHVQQEYIQKHIQMFEDVLFEGNSDYHELMDVESAAKYWLVQNFCLNLDAYASGSTYIYKDRDTEQGVSKIYWGPLWDFDFAYDHIDTTEGFIYSHEWLRPLFYDRSAGGFIEELHKQWPVMKAALEELIREGGVMDRYYEETKASAEYEHMMLDPDTEFSYEEAVETLRTWIRERLAWVDANFDLLNNLMHKVEFSVQGEVYRNVFLTEENFIFGNEEYPDIEGYTFRGWLDEDGNIITDQIRVTKDMTITGYYVPDSELTHVEEIAFSKASDVIRFSSFFNTYRIPYAIIPEDPEDSDIFWKSSDPALAAVDRTGTVKYYGTGTVTFSAKLKNGREKQFVLSIINDDFTAPESIYPEEEVIVMTPGSQANFCIATEPTPVKINSYEYSSDDESVVTAGEYGVLTAVGPGETKVHVRTVSYDAEGNEVILETYVTVIVAEEEPEPEIEYTFTDDSQSEWKKGSGTDLVLTVKRSVNDETCFSHFTGVQIDGVPLAKDTGYTAVQGSTIITVKAAALQVLKEGSHTIKAEFDDGIAEKEINILAEDEKKDDAKPVSPDTSDSVNRAWPYIMIAALLIFALALKTRLSTR